MDLANFKADWRETETMEEFVSSYPQDAIISINTFVDTFLSKVEQRMNKNSTDIEVTTYLLLSLVILVQQLISLIGYWVVEMNLLNGFYHIISQRDTAVILIQFHVASFWFWVVIVVIMWQMISSLTNKLHLTKWQTVNLTCGSRKIHKT